ncbi:22245_t:CDS:2 [Gigaspora margarita]|uniref:22245_t:CDS:1 n=1 Tax=Gigaspora margarita TaxID=4874 RepID=A0ABN7UXJ8_GIGMA|nr:22245_t:CDS:2 [Gigaspora margarita]
MASIFCAVSFIKTISNANKFTTGIATYRAGDDEFVEYKFKAFQSEDTPLIGEIWKKQIALIIGRFAIQNDELNITINQYIPLNISSLGDEPSIYDLPIAPAFGVFTAPIQDPTVIENGQGIFRLKRDVYNGVTANQSSLSILCKYPLHNRHATVKDATTRRPIFSNYSALSPNTPSYAQTNTPSTSDNKRRRQDELERVAENSIPIILQPRISIKNIRSDSLVPIILPLHRLIRQLQNNPHIPDFLPTLIKANKPTTLEKDMRTPSITTNNNFIPNHNTTVTPHEYSDLIFVHE